MYPVALRIVTLTLLALHPAFAKWAIPLELLNKIFSATLESDPQVRESRRISKRPYVGPLHRYEDITVQERKLSNPLNKTVLKIGFLIHRGKNVKLHKTIELVDQGRTIPGAITYAVDVINNDTNLLPDYILNVLYVDQDGRNWFGVEGVSLLRKEGAVAFFGPEQSCRIEGQMAATYNLPMFGYNCYDEDVSDKVAYPTFVRTTTTYAQIAECVVAFIKEYNWTKLSVIYNSLSRHYHHLYKFYALCARDNISIQHSLHYTFYLPGFSKVNPFINITRKTIIDTRVYVFFGKYNDNGIYGFLKQLDHEGGTEGDHVVIYVPETHIIFHSHTKYPFFNRMKTREGVGDVMTLAKIKRGRHLLVFTKKISVSQAVDEEFREQVRKYNHKDPFFIKKIAIRGFKKIITDHAVNLYDSVYLYARTLHDHLKTGNLTDGKAIVSKILHRSFTSVTGSQVFVTRNGDVLENFTILTMAENGTYFKELGFFVAAQNSSSHVYSAQFVHVPGVRVNWVHGFVPPDEPTCGFHGEKCIHGKSYSQLTLLSVVLGIILVLMPVAIACTRYRSLKLATMTWRIPRADIITKTVKRRPSAQNLSQCGSKSSVNTVESGHQKYATVVQYKGNIVAIKTFERRKVELSTAVKAEMGEMRYLLHSNVVTFYGAYTVVDLFHLVTEYFSRGSLQDVLVDDDMKLDRMFKASFIHDLIKGLGYIHGSRLSFHGNLKSSNCVINSRWTLALTDYGLLSMRHSVYSEEDEYPFYRNKLWSAPEIMRLSKHKGSQLADIYAFGIILHEVWIREGPFNTWSTNTAPRDIVEKVKNKRDPLVRPTVKVGQTATPDYVIDTMRACWSENPDERPRLGAVKKLLSPMRIGMKNNIIDNMISIMETHQNNLENLVCERTKMLNEEKVKSDGLLYRMLPKTVADVLKSGGVLLPESYDCVTIFFSDIVGFTALSSDSTPLQIVDFLNDLYTLFDSTIANYDVYKVETIGDAYMVVSGLPVRNQGRHATEIASMSLTLLNQLKTFKIRHRPGVRVDIRIGIHSGSCVAGVVGFTMPRFCLFGDTVNTASRMESNGLPNKVHVSAESRNLISKLGGFVFEERGLIAIKGKGEMFTYWLVSEDASLSRDRSMTGNKDSPLDWHNLFSISRPNSTRSKITRGFFDIQYSTTDVDAIMSPRMGRNRRTSSSVKVVSSGYGAIDLASPINQSFSDQYNPPI